MGINLCIMKSGFGDEHPSWDSIRRSPDSEFYGMALHLPSVHDEENREFWRPSDFPAWRAAIAAKNWEPVSVARYEQMLAILETEPDYWLVVL